VPPFLCVASRLALALINASSVTSCRSLTLSFSMSLLFLFSGEGVGVGSGVLASGAGGGLGAWGDYVGGVRFRA
jgi:hypothetical protein